MSWKAAASNEFSMAQSSDKEEDSKCLNPNIAYCGSPVAVGKWLIMILAAIVLGLVLAEHDDQYQLILRGEEYTVITAVLTLVLCLSYLVVYVLGCQKGWCSDCKCHCQVLLFYILGSMMWFAAGGVETYATVDYLDRGLYYRYRRRASAATFCYLNGVILGSLALRNLGVAIEDMRH